MSKKLPVQFGRAEAKMIGKTRQIPSGVKLYTSKCGKYQIEGREFVLPYKSFAYTLYRIAGDVRTRVGGGGQHDKLADAKLAACYDADPTFDGEV